MSTLYSMFGCKWTILDLVNIYNGFSESTRGDSEGIAENKIQEPQCLTDETRAPKQISGNILK